MSEIAPLENDSHEVKGVGSPVTKSPQSVTPKKRTWKEIVSVYRAAGYPNAKRFRKQTKLEAAEAIISIYKNALARAVTCQGAANVILAKVANESNWAVREIDQPNYQGTRIEWVADDDVCDEAQKFLKRFNQPTALAQDQKQE